MVTNTDGQPFSKMMIPSDKVSLVIGTRGAVIMDIQRRSGAKVQVEKADPNDRAGLGLRTVVIVGTEEQQAEARAEINRVIGTTAGTREFKEDEFASGAQSTYIPGVGPLNSIFNSAIDFETMQKLMEMQMSSSFMYGQQPTPDGQPPQPLYGMYGQPMPPPQQAAAPQEAPAAPKEKEEEKGVEEEEAPPGFD